MFKPLDRYNYTSTRVLPPKVHITGLVTGGLGNLYKDIENGNCKRSEDHGRYTDSSGKFSPHYNMPLLASRYKFVELLGVGQSSVCISAMDTFHKDNLVSIKILHTNYHTLGPQEGMCVMRLNSADPYMYSPTLRLKNIFSFGDHYCLVFELLKSRPLTYYFKNVESKECILKLKKVAVQLLKGIGFMQQQNLIHADLKPDNILLAADDLSSMKIVDFGNAIHCTHEEMSLYYESFELQTLLYRAPEVMFGMSFGLEVDMWSLGCVLAELYIGEPIFQGPNKIAIIQKMYKILGPFPSEVYTHGKFSKDLSCFISRKPTASSGYDTPLKKLLDNFLFSDFVSKLLCYDPRKRMTVQEASSHPFLAHELGFNFLNSSNDLKYPTVFLDKSNYNHKPKGQSTLLSPSNHILPETPPLPIRPAVDRNHNNILQPDFHKNQNVLNVTNNSHKNSYIVVQEDPSINTVLTRSVKHRHSVGTTSEPLILKEHKYNITDSNVVAQQTGLQSYAQINFPKSSSAVKDTPMSSTSNVIYRKRRRHQKGEGNEIGIPNINLPKTSLITTESRSQHVLQAADTSQHIQFNPHQGSKKMKTDKNQTTTLPERVARSSSVGYFVSKDPPKQYYKERSQQITMKAYSHSSSHLLNKTFTFTKNDNESQSMLTQPVDVPTIKVSALAIKNENPMTDEDVIYV